MPAQRLTRRTKHIISQGRRLHIAHRLELPLHPADLRDQPRHRIFLTVERRDPTAQIHVTAALRRDGNPSLRRGANILPHRFVGGQLRQKHFRETAAKQEPIHVRQLRVAQRAERHNRRALLLQHPQTLRVIKRKRLVPGHADPAGTLRRQRRFGRQFQRFRLRGQFQQRRDIQAAGNGGMNVGQHRFRGILRHRQQPEMPFRHLQALRPPDHAQHAHADPCQRLGHHLFVGIRADLVQDDPGQADLRIILLKAEHHGGDAFTGAATVHDQHHRRPQQTGDGRRTGHAAAAAIVQAHHAFHHGDVHAAGSLFKNRQQALRRHQPAVQIVTGPPRGERMIAGIDIIRSHLVGLDLLAAQPQFAQEAADNCRLAHAALRAGDHQPGNGNQPVQYSTPHLPRIPRLIGCFTAAHSVASSASASTIAGISRPVNTSRTFAAVCRSHSTTGDAASNPLFNG